MPNEVRSAGVYDTPTSLAARAGFARSRHWAYVVSNGLMYRWVASDTTAIDGFLVVGHTGGSAGRWLALFGATVGANLTNGNATISAAGGLIRRIPAATLTDDRVLTFSPTGVATGAIFTIVRNDQTMNTVALVNGGPSAGTIYTMPAGVTGTVDVLFDGTNFERLRVCLDA